MYFQAAEGLSREGEAEDVRERVTGRPEDQEVSFRSPAESLRGGSPFISSWSQEPGELGEEAEAFKSGRKGGPGGCSWLTPSQVFSAQ